LPIPSERPRGIRNHYYDGPASDHFDGSLFSNPTGGEPGSLRDLLKWRFANRREPWPALRPSPHRPARPEPRVEGGRLVVTMVGHATMLVQTAGLNLLPDPVWADRASPFSFVGPKRVNQPGIALADLPRIDAVLLSHNHYDHLDLATLSWLSDRDDPVIVTPLGNDAIVRTRARSARFATGDWGDRVEIANVATVHFEPVHHWSARGLRDRRMALWAGFVIETPAGRILHVGDSGFAEGTPFEALARRHGSFRLALLPIGAYEPRWFMRHHHMNPAESVQAMQLANAETALGHHWGTFRLTDEAIDAPSEALAAALGEARIEPARFRPLLPGLAVEVA